MTEADKNLEGLLNLTDETGVSQHSKYRIIDRRFGYATDDNARALIAAVRHHERYGTELSLRLAERYLEFLLYMHKDDGGYHNKLGFDRIYQDEAGTEDCLGHALWAAGYTMNSGVPDKYRELSKYLFDRSLPRSRSFTSPRAKAFTLMGLCGYHHVYPSDEAITQEIKSLANYFTEIFGSSADSEWKWFEDYLTYANPRIPQSMFEAAGITGEARHVEVAKESFDFLINTQFKHQVFHPIGTNGWYEKGGEKADYDQQPIEASCMVEAATVAWTMLGDDRYKKVAERAFAWFHGENSHGVPLFDQDSYTCYDGLTSEGLNINQGAESTISYLLAELCLGSIPEEESA
ncbi:glycosyltransferase [Candidatus Bathyarchaeota archaeon]|nr:glycosyltransferase [Candidatus Bathyarchaeota archaeon]